MNPNMDKKVKLIVGDWSYDGHNQVETFHILSTHEGKDIERFYKNGVKLLRCDPSQDVDPYENNKLKEKTVSALTQAGFNFDDVEGAPTLCAEEYVLVYMFVARHGSDNALEWKLDESVDSINIGGYGLFS